MADKDRGPLGEALKRLRGSTGQRALATLSGVSESLIANIEIGDRNGSKDTIEKLAAALRLPKAGRNELLAAREAYAAWDASRGPSRVDELTDATDYNSRLARMPDHVLQAVNDIIDAEERRRGLA